MGVTPPHWGCRGPSPLGGVTPPLSSPVAAMVGGGQREEEERTHGLTRSKRSKWPCSPQLRAELGDPTGPGGVELHVWGWRNCLCHRGLLPQIGARACGG